MKNSKENNTESKNVLKTTSISKKTKSIIKIKPQLPISLPLSFFQTYLEKTKCRKEREKQGESEKQEDSGVITKHIQAPESEMAVENSAQTCNINDLLNQSYKSRDTQTELLESALYPQLHLYIVQDSSFENKDCEVVASKSEVATNTEIDTSEISSQTDDIQFVNDSEILRIIKQYDISKEDIENLHQDMLNNNNNQSDHTNLNIPLTDTNDEEIEIIEAVEEELTLPDKYNYLSDSISTITGNESIQMFSNLNKLVFKCLYKSINLKSQKNNDKSAITKELTQIGEKLVHDIHLFIKNSNGNHVRILDVIDLIDDSEEVSCESTEEEMSTDCRVLSRKRQATDEPLDLQSDTSKQAKVNEATSQPQQSLQVSPLQISPEQIVSTQTRQELPQTTNQFIESFQHNLSQHQPTETETIRPLENRPENIEMPYLNQAHRTQSMPDVNPVRFPYQLYRNEPRLPYYNNPQPYQRPPENSHKTNQQIPNCHINNHRAVDIGKQKPITLKNQRELQKRLDYLQAFNYLNTSQNLSNNTTQFPQNQNQINSNSMRFVNSIEQQRQQLQQTPLNSHRIPNSYKNNVRY